MKSLFSPNDELVVDSTPDTSGVQTWNALVSAVSSAQDEATIIIGNTLTATSTITISKNITIKSVEGKRYTIKRDATISDQQYLFDIQNGCTLTLGDSDSGYFKLDGLYSEELYAKYFIYCAENLNIEKNCILENNYSNLSGGAIYALLADETNEKITINIKGKIRNCETSVTGGAIYAEGKTNNKIEVNLIGCEISCNKAKSNGGGICAKYSKVNMTDNSAPASIHDNSETNTSNTQGGAFWVGNTDLNISCGEIKNNSAINGGAIYANNGAVVNITGGTFSNTATTGKEIYKNSGTVTINGTAQSSHIDEISF